MELCLEKYVKIVQYSDRDWEIGNLIFTGSWLIKRPIGRIRSVQISNFWTVAVKENKILGRIQNKIFFKNPIFYRLKYPFFG